MDGLASARRPMRRGFSCDHAAMMEPSASAPAAVASPHRSRFPVVAALIAAVIGGGAGVGGSYLGAHAAVQANDSLIRATQAQTTRDKRAAVYSAYLDAANNYADQDRRAFDLLTNELKGVKAGTGVEGPPASFSAARFAYQGAINSLYVYGSDAAWTAHQEVAAVLPASLGGDGFQVTRVDSSAFESAYRGFLRVFCGEVPAVPRSGC